MSADRPGTWQSLGLAMTSWRTASVSLLSFSSGLPLALVWIAIPDWMRDSNVDIRLVGLFTLAHAPWTFKFLWSPFMDRYTPPWLGRRRGWVGLTQIALLVLTLCLAGLGSDPDAVWVVGALALAIAFASASQDIALDAYAVDVLQKEEHGPVVGARTAIYRAAMFVAGGLSITVAAIWSWQVVCVGLALLYLPMMVITWAAPEPASVPQRPKTLREAVWLPFLGCLARHRALEILAFVVLYKLADSFSQSLLRPFLIDMEYSAMDRGVALATFGLVFTLAGTLLGGLACSAMGLGHSLWVFGFLQIFSNVGYIVITYSPGNRPLMYGAMVFELFTTGLGMGAFGVLLLRLTQKRFSATQYALYSSLFSVPRIFAGPITGFLVDAIGWRFFFWGTMAAGIPGLLLLQRFSPLGVREPEFTVEPPRYRHPLSTVQLALCGLAGGIAGLATSTLLWGSIKALKLIRLQKDAGVEPFFDLHTAIMELAHPVTVEAWLELVGILVFAVMCGLAVAAVLAARHGERPEEEQ